VFITVSDPVGSGFVASLARPGGNVTGLGGFGAEIRLKQLELLQEVTSREPRVALVFNPEFGFHAHARAEIEAAARQRGIVLLPIEARYPKDIDAALAVAERERADALLLLGQAVLPAAPGAHRTTRYRLATSRRASEQRRRQGWSPDVIRLASR
jgi:putative ABC transport system substrate-binding protein